MYYTSKSCWGVHINVFIITTHGLLISSDTTYMHRNSQDSVCVDSNATMVLGICSMSNGHGLNATRRKAVY